MFLMPITQYDTNCASSRKFRFSEISFPSCRPKFKAKVVLSRVSRPRAHAWQLCAGETAAITINNRCKFAGTGGSEMRFQFRTLTPFVIGPMHRIGQNSNRTTILKHSGFCWVNEWLSWPFSRNLLQFLRTTIQLRSSKDLTDVAIPFTRSWTNFSLLSVRVITTDNFVSEL